MIVGQGKEKNQLQAKVKQLGINNITFIDAIPKIQIQSMLAEFNVCFIGLAQDELFHYGVSPNKLFDYFCSAKPIIYAIDSGDYRPVSDAKAGIQIEPESVSELVNAVKTLYNMDKLELHKMGQNGQEIVKTHYEYQSLAKKLEDIIFIHRHPK